MTSPIGSGSDLLAGLEGLGAKRGRPRLLDREEALKVALDLINSEGLGALTMRRLATELDVGTATVHNTFGGKEQLLQDLAETVFADLPDAATLTAHTPDEALVEYFTAVYRMLVSQPAIAQLTVLRRMRHRNLFRAHETIYELLREMRVGGQDAYDTYDTLTKFAFGFALNRIAHQDFDRDATIASLPAEQYPMVKVVGPLHSRRTPEEQLQAGIRQIIRGCRSS